MLVLSLRPSWCVLGNLSINKVALITNNIMSEDYVIHIKGEAVDKALKLPGPWVVGNVVQAIGWPEEDMIIKYEDSDLHLLTYDDERDLMPAVALRLSDGISDTDAKDKITRFLSALNWVSSGSIVLDGWIGGGRPIRSINKKGTKFTALFFKSHISPVI